ncbi:MAG: hypothetical protein K2I81_03720 [Alphaproteobacteria bacterium]|nr:hypothetical protein [Alphaproteobacteria bacterium]
MAYVNDRRTRPSVAQQLFSEVYVPHIADMILKKHGGSYACYENDRNTWRSYIPYSAKIEDEFIMETKMFIVFLDHYVKKLAENPEFVMAFVKMVVDYLSAYTMKNPRFPKRTRKKAKEALMQTLWSDFAHIQKMLERQAARREERRERNIRYKTGGKKAPSDPNKDAYDKMKATQRRLASGRGPKQK